MKLIFTKFIFKLFLLLELFSCNISQKIESDTDSDSIIMSNYEYPSPIPSDIINVAIMSTSDIHGAVFPNRFQAPNDTLLYSGGVINMYSYVKALRKEWQNYFLWLDGGDQFQGTMEVMLSEGEIMKDYYNYVNLDGIAIGNHEFDYGIERLKQYIEKEKYPTLCANLFDKKAQKYIWEEGMWKNVEPYHIYTLGGEGQPKIRLGVIGLATAETVLYTSTDLSDYIFDNYYDVTKIWTDHLRLKEKVDAVILLVHFGPNCPLEPEEKLKLKIRDKNTVQKECREKEEIMPFLKKLESEELKIDAILGAHIHDIVHHWIRGIPVIETANGANYFHVLYLPFKVNENGGVTLQNNDIKIEGPVPVCEKIWPDTKECSYRGNEPTTNMKKISYHNSILETDQGIIQALDNWYTITKPKLENIIARTDTEITLNGQEESVLTNLVNDIGKIITGADICFYNMGSLSHSWHVGGITEIDVFKMFSFNNTWNVFDMTGEEVIKMFKELNINDIYPATGITQTYVKKNMKNYLRDIELWDGIKKSKIELDKTYKVCTNDFLASGGIQMRKIREWYDLRNLEIHGIIRDDMVKYFKSMKVIKREYYIDEKNPNLIILKEDE
jgi:2',3'-cyclic-nucleotide 2'-phosphodiesterase/3'-nucleotidase